MAIIPVTVDQVRAATEPFPINDPSDVYVLTDLGANIATLTGTEVGQLAGLNISSIDATDDLVVLSIPQLINLGSVALTPADVVVFRATGADLETGTPADVEDLATRSVDFIDASDDVLTYSFEQFSALRSVSFTAADTVTITATAAQVQGLSPADIATMSAKNVDVLDPDAAVTLTAAQAAAFAGSGISFPAADDVAVVDTGTNLATLTDTQIVALIAKGVDAFDATDNAITLSLAQFSAFGATLADNDAVTLSDTGSNIAALTPTAIAALAGQGVIAIDASDDTLTLTFEQYNSLGAVILTDADTVSISGTADALVALNGTELAALEDGGIDLLDASDNLVTLTAAQFAVLATTNLAFAANDTVIYSDTGQNIATLGNADVASLAAKGVDVVDASDNVVSLSVDQAKLLTGAGLSFAAADTVTVSDTSTALAQLSAADIAALTARGVDVIDATDNTLTLTAAQAAALAGGGSSVAAGDTVTVADTGAALAALTPAQLAALNGKGIDALNASDNLLALSVAQLNALGSIGLTADDAIRLTDVGSTLSGLSAGQIAGLAARGVDTLDATDNAVSLSLAQYQSLGAVQISAEDRVTINGTSASERIDGRANNEYIKGFGGNDRLNGNDGNDWLSGGTGKDILTGGRGADGFVFDARPSKKTNYDTVRDFNVRDDSVYLDNAIFKKLGRGSEANPGKLNKAFFQIGERADDRNDYLIYNKKTGILYYDANGSGAGGQVEIAKLSKNLKLTYKDFFII